MDRCGSSSTNSKPNPPPLCDSHGDASDLDSFLPIDDVYTVEGVVRTPYDVIGRHIRLMQDSLKIDFISGFDTGMKKEDLRLIESDLLQFKLRLRILEIHDFLYENLSATIHHIESKEWTKAENKFLELFPFVDECSEVKAYEKKGIHAFRKLMKYYRKRCGGEDVSLDAPNTFVVGEGGRPARLDMDACPKTTAAEVRNRNTEAQDNSVQVVSMPTSEFGIMKGASSQNTQKRGLTETCAGTFVSLPNELSMLGTVGPPVPNVDVCLESVPAMEYDALSSTPRGEILVSGDTLFSGYYKREDLTKEVLVDGWFHTGDIGEWEPGGSMKIIDRKKNIFKLSQGEYVAVEHLENIYSNVQSIDSIWVYGNSFECFLVAVVNPNRQGLERWAKDSGEKAVDFAELCESSKAKEYILGELAKTAKEKKVERL